MRETTIHWMNDEKCADVSTCDQRMIAQIEGNSGRQRPKVSGRGSA